MSTVLAVLGPQRHQPALDAVPAAERSDRIGTDLRIVVG